MKVVSGSPRNLGHQQRKEQLHRLIQTHKSYLQYFAGDKALAVIAFDAKLTLIVFLAVGQSISDWWGKEEEEAIVDYVRSVCLNTHKHLLAHVLSVQQDVTRSTLETPDVPLVVQCN